jgi:topoisomerase-4 subunit A
LKSICIQRGISVQDYHSALEHTQSRFNQDLAVLYDSLSPELIEMSGDFEKQLDVFEMLIDVKGWKALGNKLSAHEVRELKLIESEQVTDMEGVVEEEQEGQEEESSNEDPVVDQTDDLEVGSTLTLTPKKGEDEQLGLF